MHFLGFVVMGLALLGLVVALRPRRGRTWRDDVIDTAREPVEDRRHRELQAAAARRRGVARPRDRAPGLRRDDAHGSAARPRAWLRRHQGLGSHGGRRVAHRRHPRWRRVRDADAPVSRQAWRSVAAILVGMLILFELAAPSPTAAISTSDATLDVYRALDDRGKEPVVELPMIQPIRPHRDSPGPRSRRRGCSSRQSTGIPASTATRATSPPATRKTCSCSTRSRRPTPSLDSVR